MNFIHVLNKAIILKQLFALGSVITVNTHFHFVLVNIIMHQ